MGKTFKNRGHKDKPNKRSGKPKEKDIWKMSYPIYYQNNFSVRKVTEKIEQSLRIK